MDNIIISKKNGKTIIKNLNSLSFLQNEIINDSNDDDILRIFDNTVYMIIRNLNKKGNKPYIDMLMSKIKNAKTYEGLETVASYFLLLYKDANKDANGIGEIRKVCGAVNLISDVIESHKEYAIDKIVTGLINCYYSNTLSMFNNNQLNDLIVNINDNDLLMLLSMYNRDIDGQLFNDYLNNKIITGIYNSIISRVFSSDTNPKNKYHKCSDCSYASNCPKVEAFFGPKDNIYDEKLTLDKYPFIYDGIQLLSRRPISNKKPIGDSLDFYQENNDSNEDYGLLTDYYVDQFLVGNCNPMDKSFNKLYK